MFPQIDIKHNIGNTITIPNQIDVRAYTYSSSPALSGTVSIGADNTTDFTSGNLLLLISSIGLENTEIVGSSTHSTTDFTTDALAQSHSRGEILQEIRWDQVSIYKSITAGGTYNLFSTKTLQVTQTNTIFFDSTGLITDFYKVQWKNSLTGETSSLSDEISVITYPVNSAGNMFTSVMVLTGVKENDKSITPEFLLQALNDAREYTESKLYGIRHAWRQVFEYPVKVLAGANFIDLPDDIDFDESDRSLLACRFLNNNILTPYNLMKIDKRTWNQVAFYSTGGITQEIVNVAASTIRVNSVGDFYVQGGSAQVATTDFDQTVLQIEYTGIDYTTNELLGVTGVTRVIPSGTQIWARASMSQPIYYRVDMDKLWFSSLIPDSMQGNNLYLDYYKKLIKIDNYYDVIPEHYREMYKFYLRWAIKYRKDVTTPTSDPDLTKFNELVDALFANLYTGQDSIIITS